MDKTYVINDQKNWPKLNGNEYWPILGDALTDDDVDIILKRCTGLQRHWNCIEKACHTYSHLGHGQIVIGAMEVISGDNSTRYGFDFVPPYEFHAWVSLCNASVIDVALPGVIEAGLMLSDSKGPYLVDREPVILAGDIPDWVVYDAQYILSHYDIYNIQQSISRGV